MNLKIGFDHFLQQDRYQEYLSRLDVRALLAHYGAENQIEQTNHDGTTEIVHSCLLDRVEPHHANGDLHPSASVNVDKRVFVCYSGGIGCDLLHLVMKMEGKESLGEALGVAGEFLVGANRQDATMVAELEKIFASGLAYDINLPSYDERVLSAWNHPHPYWGQRGITSQAQELLRLGHDPVERRIVFPHFVDNTLVGWQKRVIPGETIPEHPKYRNSSGFPKSETLYGLDLAKDSPLVVVVESPMSVARAYSVGLEVPVVATFGSKNSQAQANLLKKFSAVFVWFDRDAAGLAGERQLVERLYLHTRVLVVSPDKDRDMGDCSRSQMEDKLGEDAEVAALRLARYDRREDWAGGRKASFHP